MASARNSMEILEGDSQEQQDVEEGRQIPIANIYHLLCYAWGFFELDVEVQVEADNHSGYTELLTKVLTAGCVHLIKQGLHRDYQARTEPMRAVRGKLELAPSLATGRLEQGIAVCTHDEFTADIPANQILKSVLMRMARSRGMDAILASAARNAALRMTGVSAIELHLRMLGRVRIHRNNRFYGFLLSICQLVMEAVSVKESQDALVETEQRFYGVIEKRLPALFEAFSRKFYQKHVAGAGGWTHAGRRNLNWQWEALTLGSEVFLPKMETDITLEHPDRKIIMDTKFYNSGGISREKFHSTNMYQLNSYVTQCAMDARARIARGDEPRHPHDIDAEGMLLYATVGDQDFHHKYSMPPHRMAVATVNLARDWQTVEARLLEVIEIRSNEGTGKKA